MIYKNNCRYPCSFSICLESSPEDVPTPCAGFEPTLCSISRRNDTSPVKIANKLLNTLDPDGSKTMVL